MSRFVCNPMSSDSPYSISHLLILVQCSKNAIVSKQIMRFNHPPITLHTPQRSPPRQVHSIKLVKVDLPRMKILRWIIRVIKAVTKVGIVWIFIRVRKSEAMSNLVTHGIPSMIILGIVQIILIHLRHTTNNHPIHNLIFIDTDPTSLSKVVITNNHHPVLPRTSTIHLPPLRSQRQSRTLFPIGNRIIKLLLPIIRQYIDQSQMQPPIIRFNMIFMPRIRSIIT
mmetsp:Transcript_8742/g.19617  ORF Transcript_8742/g.19617 Transcript_8742/m.19617 type:complete len:225 (+) Transcript_8742:61-735(+)